MVAQSRRQRLILPTRPVPIAPAAGGAAALLTAALIALMPVTALESLILRSGVAAVLAAAEPPLGATARLVLILTVGGVVGLIVWLGTFLLVGARALAVGGEPSVDAVPKLRRADAHPDAPARAPLFAHRDLGTPFLDIRANRQTDDPATPAPIEMVEEAENADVRPLPILRPMTEVPVDVPADLDLPLAAFDPAAIPDVPMAPPAPPPPSLAPRPQVIDSGDRFETFQLRPVVKPVATADFRVAPQRAPVDTKATLTALLERLERGVADRSEDRADRPTPPSEGLEQTLGLLRRMATRG